MDAERHAAFLACIADKVQLPAFTNEAGEERGRKILYFRGSAGLAEGLGRVQREAHERCPAPKGLQQRWRREQEFPGIGRRKGYGAIAIERGWERVLMAQGREMMAAYSRNLVPGGLLLFDAEQFSQEGDMQSAYTLMARLERSIETVRLEDPLLALARRLAPEETARPRTRSYLLGRKRI